MVLGYPMRPHPEPNTITQGDALQVLKTWPDSFKEEKTSLHLRVQEPKGNRIF